MTGIPRKDWFTCSVPELINRCKALQELKDNEPDKMADLIEMYKRIDGALRSMDKSDE